MNTMYVYGDSFSDPNHKFGVVKPYFWITELEKYFEVHNFSIKGSGPQYQLNCLINTIENTDPSKLKQSNMIFFMSDINRHWWNFMEPSDQYLYAPILFNHKANTKEAAEKILKYRSYKEWLKNYDRYTGMSENYNITNVINNIYAFSKFFNKTLFWPIFNNVPDYLKKYNTREFNIVPKLLNDISSNEKISDNQKNMHLHKKNHLIMQDEIYLWMKKNYTINVKNFKGNIDE